MYLLFLDESGTHGGSPVFIVGGLAVHEDDAADLQNRVERYLHSQLTPLGLNAYDFELHATELKNGNGRWQQVPLAVRRRILRGAYRSLTGFQPRHPGAPVTYFGAVLDVQKVPARLDREQYAYELVLKKFDDMLRRLNRRAAGFKQRGLVVHDQRVVHGTARAWTHERAIQEWTREWREAAGRVGKLRNFADVPLFADSKATRLLQAADLVAYAIWRFYGLPSADGQWLNMLLPGFDAVQGSLHGLIHVSPEFAKRACSCPPCANRLGGS